MFEPSLPKPAASAAVKGSQRAFDNLHESHAFRVLGGVGAPDADGAEAVVFVVEGDGD